MSKKMTEKEWFLNSNNFGACDELRPHNKRGEVIKKLGETTKLKHNEILCDGCKDIKPRCYATSRITKKSICKECEEKEAMDEYLRDK